MPDKCLPPSLSIHPPSSLWCPSLQSVGAPRPLPVPRPATFVAPPMTMPPPPRLAAAGGPAPPRGYAMPTMPPPPMPQPPSDARPPPGQMHGMMPGAQPPGMHMPPGMSASMAPPPPPQVVQQLSRAGSPHDRMGTSSPAPRPGALAGGWVPSEPGCGHCFVWRRFQGLAASAVLVSCEQHACTCTHFWLYCCVLPPLCQQWSCAPLQGLRRPPP